MTHTHVELSQTGFQGVPHDDHENLKLHRLNETRPTDKSHYLMTSIGEVNVGEPFSTYFPATAVGYIIEGEMHIKDESKPDEVTKLVAGDVIHIDQGSNYSLSSPTGARMFGVSYAPSHLHPEDYVVKK